jgi:hypothetical protein
LKINSQRSHELLGRVFNLYAVFASKNDYFSVDEKIALERTCFDLCQKRMLSNLGSIKALVLLLGTLNTENLLDIVRSTVFVYDQDKIAY